MYNMINDTSAKDAIANAGSLLLYENNRGNPGNSRLVV